ncbi:hypothetical protein FHS61_002729 [Altererythrobacter atlanticus]|uniref:Uncharacterized protein n=1 Tax=Croceibacterium atlanticum TaxID=1267766 RepID=A0A0F7KVW8_9SPHN|nr:DUF2721 domain-containing protein [Croceibacterium atlanticum]AKH43864.1 hypothetical protein WYH_02836 [Croceibacterium atlanticum]MBB5733686.1 hypothetical protein [Croceibacterium atlanticum]
MIAQTIQLALAPVFMLVAIGNIMNILSTRLGRVVDRSRVLQQLHAETSGVEHDAVVREMRMVARRIRIISQAILLLVASGLTVGIVVALLFVEELADLDLQLVVAGAFTIAIGLLMIALVLFIRETRQATEALQIPETYLELERKL